jgi:hypothetical protein
MKVQIMNSEVKPVNGTSAKTGKPYAFRTQEGYAFTLDRKTGRPHPYPTKFEIMLDNDQEPYLPGDYTVSEASFYVDRFGKLNLSPRLEPVRTSNPAAAK